MASTATSGHAGFSQVEPKNYSADPLAPIALEQRETSQVDSLTVTVAELFTKSTANFSNLSSSSAHWYLPVVKPTYDNLWSFKVQMLLALVVDAAHAHAFLAINLVIAAPPRNCGRRWSPSACWQPKGASVVTFLSSPKWTLRV